MLPNTDSTTNTTLVPPFSFFRFVKTQKKEKKREGGAKVRDFHKVDFKV